MMCCEVASDSEVQLNLIFINPQIRQMTPDRLSVTSS